MDMKASFSLQNLRKLGPDIYAHLFILQNIAHELSSPLFWARFLYARDSLELIARFNFALQNGSFIQKPNQKAYHLLEPLKIVNLAKPFVVILKSMKFALIAAIEKPLSKRFAQHQVGISMAVGIFVQCLFLAIEAPLVIIEQAIDGLLKGVKALYQQARFLIAQKNQVREEKARHFKRFSRLGFRLKKREPKTIPLIEFFGISDHSIFQEKILSPLTQLGQFNIKLPLNDLTHRVAVRHVFSPERLLVLENLCKENHLYGWSYQRNDTQNPYISIINENGHAENILIKNDHLAIVDSPRRSHIIYDAIAKIMRAMGYPVVGICNNNNRLDNIVFSAEKMLSNGRVFILENKLFCKNKITYDDIMYRSKNPYQEDLLRRLLNDLEKKYPTLYNELPPTLTIKSQAKKQELKEED